jgi:hypothetical protein
VDIAVIALWLGHESTTTTHMYLEADLSMKERGLADGHPINRIAELVPWRMIPPAATSSP